MEVHYLKILFVMLPLASCVTLLRLEAALSSGPRNRSRNESGLSSSTRLLCAHSLSLTTRFTNLTHTHQAKFQMFHPA